MRQSNRQTYNTNMTNKLLDIQYLSQNLSHRDSIKPLSLQICSQLQ